MTAIQQIINKGNQLNQKEIETASSILFNLFHIKVNEEKGISDFESQITFIEEFNNFLIRILKSEWVQTREQRVALIKIISKLTQQKEVLEILSGTVNLDDLKVAAKRFGKKAQSSVGGGKLVRKDKQ